MTERTRTWIDGIDRTAVAVVVAVLLLIACPPPKILHYSSYVKYFVLQTAACLLAVLWSVRAIRSEPRANATSRPWPQMLLAALVVLSFLSAFWSGLPYITFLGSLMLAVRIGWCLLVSSFHWTDRRIRVFAWGLVGAGAIAAVATLALKAHGSPAWRGYVIGHRNFLACFLIAPICVAAFGAATGRLTERTGRKAPRVIAGLAALLMLVTFLLTGSMGAFLGLLAAGPAFAFAVSRGKRRRQLLVAAVCVVLVGASALLVTWPTLRPRILRGDQATRYFHALGALRMIADRPLLGHGTGTYLSRFPHYRPIEAGQYGWMGQLSLHPHNEYASVGIQNGIIGLLLFLGALALASRNIARRTAGGRSPLMAALFAGFFGMLLHGLFTVSLSFWGSGAIFWTLLGVLLAAARPGEEPGPERRFALANAVPVALCLALVSVAWWQFAWQGLVSEWEIGKGRLGKLAPEESDALYQQAISKSVYIPDYVLHTHSLIGDLFAREGAYSRSVVTFERMRLLAPDLYELDLRLARLHLRMAGHPTDRAAALYNAMVTVRPYHAGAVARREYAATLRELSTQYLPMCIEQMRAAVTLQPADPANHFLLARYLAEAGRLPEALKAIDAASRLRAADATTRSDAAAQRAYCETELAGVQILAAMGRTRQSRSRLTALCNTYPRYEPARRLLESTATPGGTATP